MSVKQLYKGKFMRKLEPNNDIKAFFEAMSCLKKVAKEIQVTQKEFEEQKQQVKDSLVELETLIDSIPTK